MCLEDSQSSPLRVSVRWDIKSGPLIHSLSMIPRASLSIAASQIVAAR
jgi:hypothetical protein